VVELQLIAKGRTIRWTPSGGSTALTFRNFTCRRWVIGGVIALNDSMEKLRTHRLVLILTLAAFAGGLLISWYRSAEEARYGMSCSNNLKQIGLGLGNYEAMYHCLPLAAQTGSDGRLWRSWRTQVYPVLIDASPVKYDALACWDAPANMRLLKAPFMGCPSVFICPRHRSARREGIDYVVVTGALTAFPKTKRVTHSEISDGLENTILVVESVNCRPDWTEPRDLDFDTMSFTINSTNAPSISSGHPNGPLVCFADGEVYHLSPKTTETELKAMLTIAGNEDIRRQDLIERGLLSEHPGDKNR
jgi:hypothetical protein